MTKEVDAITKLYDFLLWIIPKLEKFPRLVGNVIELSFYTIVAQASLPVKDGLEARPTMKN